MASDARNNGTIVCGLTADPELVGDGGKVAKFRVAVDQAGQDQAHPDNKSGYFDVIMFRNDENPNSKFVFGQISDGKMKKGSQVAVAYRLRNARWVSDEGGNRSKVELVADAISYVGSGGGAKATDSKDESEGGSSEASSSSGNVPPKF